VNILQYNLPVIPVKVHKDEDGKYNKKPLLEWSCYIDNNTQTKEEREKVLEGLEKGEYNAVAVVCGHYVEGKGYFFAIDIDLPSQEALKKLSEIPNTTTCFEKTVSGNLHAYYFSRRPVPSFKLNGSPVELKGRGSLIVIHPSENYEALNDNTPREVEDGYSLFHEICRAFGVDFDEHLAKRAGGESADSDVSDTLEERLNEIKAELRRRGLNPQRGTNYYTCLCPFHKEKHPSFAINFRKYYAVDYHDGKIYNMRELAEAFGLKPETKKRRKKKKTQYTIGGSLLDGRLLEVVEYEGRPQLLVYRDEQFEVHESLEVDGVVYSPPPYIPFPLPRAPKAITEDPSLWAETRDFIRQHFFHLNDDVYEVLTAVVALSYFYRSLNIPVPYIAAIGPWGSGKTRLLEVLGALCYRSLHAVNFTPASLTRVIELYLPTVIIDEAQIIDPEVRAILASAYRPTGCVYRNIKPESKGFDSMAGFRVYTLCVYACRELPPDDILSRSILIQCERNLAPVKKRIDTAKAAELRTRWLTQMLRNHNRLSVTLEEFQSEIPRLEEILSPLVAIAETFGGPKSAEAVIRFGRKIEKEIKTAKATGPEAVVLAAVVDVLANPPALGENPIISVSEVTIRLNNGVNPPPWKPEAVGKVLSRLGFEAVRLPRGARGYRIDLDLLSRRAREFYVECDGLQVHFGRNCHNCHTPQISAD
jgi:hypothetical protein